jgi:drug/metabolite transporter (DMT)-like permease
MIGIYIIFSFQKWYATGILLALCSSFLAAWFTIINKNLVEKNSPTAVTFIELLSGFIFLSMTLPFVLNYFHFSFQIPGKDLSGEKNYDILWLLLLSIVCTSIAFTISLESLKKINAFTMNLSVNLEPLYSIILAMIFFNENKVLNAGFYCGTLIVISCVVIHTWVQYKSAKKVI